jgi:hypothetical protein
MKIVSSFLFLLPFFLWAQEYDSRPVMAEGQIPKDFLILSSQVHEQDKSAENKTDKRFERKAKEQFVKKNSYSLHDMLFSGNVIFNDPITTYINKVADKAFEYKPSLRKKLRFYTMKSTEVNAFATHNGVIFVTTGLISQLETESQLAMVLCHEAVHYKNKHSITKYVETQEIIRGKGEYKTLSRNNKLLEHYKYSKDLETEADLEGLDIFLTSKYSTEGIDDLFDILKYSHLPYDLVPFKKDYFETKFLKFPESYFLANEDMTPISTEERDDDESTHPNAELRKEKFLEKLAQKNNPSTKKYLVGTAEFLNTRQLCRHEISRMYLKNAQYEKAIYNSYLQLEDNPNDIFSKKVIGYSLYALATYNNENEFSQVHGDYTEKEGDWQQLYYFMNELSSKEMNVLALNYNWKMGKEFPEDSKIPMMCDSLVKGLAFDHNLRSDDFFTTLSKPDKQKKKAKKQTSGTGKLSKIKKIEDKGKIKSTEEVNDEDFWRLALFDAIQNKDLAEKLNDYYKKSKIEAPTISYKVRRKNRKLAERKKRKARSKGRALDVDKIVMLQPQYEKIDERSNKGVKLKATEKAQLRLNGMILKSAQASHLQVDLLDDMAFSKSDVNQYNDLIYLNNWLRETAFHKSNNVNLIPFEKDYLADIRKRHDTDYYCWTGFSGVHKRKSGRWGMVAASILYPPAFFFTIPYAAIPKYSTDFYIIVFNLKTEQPVWVKFGTVNKRDSDALVQTLVYDTFYQLHKKK